MTASIVKQLTSWLAENREELVGQGVAVDDRIPQLFSNVTWKATIGLIKDDIYVSYTVWERTVFQTELIVVDGQSGETLLSEDRSLERAEEIEPVLGAILRDLVTGKYRYLTPRVRTC